jgi:hypothetical protein
MPEAEIAHLTHVYSRASVILEYGSGGSTELGARMPAKYIMSVESDREWARNLRERLCVTEVVSPVVVHHADVGKTGPWGRPMDTQAWRRFSDYPNEVWDQTWFRHPDVVLIDGRFRTACFVTVLIRAEKTVRVLFDDYGVRPLYRQIEELLPPRAMIGRMAEFWVKPGQVDRKKFSLLIRQYFEGSLHGMSEAQYQAPAKPLRESS